MSKDSIVIEFPISQSKTQSSTKVPVRIHALADGLMFSLHIPPDRSLVAVLGSGNEFSNHEAIISWLINHVGVEQFETTRFPLESLSSTLYQYLNDHLNNKEY